MSSERNIENFNYSRLQIIPVYCLNSFSFSQLVKENVNDLYVYDPVNWNDDDIKQLFVDAI